MGLCATFLFSWSANASHIDVNSTDDVMNNEDGKCTLREAIKVANYGVTFGKAVGECIKTGLGLLERISLPAGTYVLTEKYDSDLADALDEEDDGYSGDLDIKYSYDIVGEGSKSTIIKAAENSFRVFDIIKGTVIISGVTIKNGYSYNGGGISNSGTLTLNDCVITENSSVASGGGIYNSPYGSLIISDCKVTENSADYGGGGIKNDGTVEIKDSTISNNSAKDADADGGGIENHKTLVVSDSTISNNTAKRDGGGLSNTDTTTITNSVFSGNDAKDSGGAIKNHGTLEVKNTTFTKNMADKQGNVIYNGKDGFVSITSSTIFLNIGGKAKTTLDNKASDKNFEIQNTILWANGANECSGEFTALGGNIIGSIPDCVIKSTPTDKLWQQNVGLSITLKDLGKPGKAFFPLSAGSLAIGVGVSDGCEDDQIHNKRKKTKRDTGAIEAVCGDGIKNGPEEQCDDENDKDNDACRNTCKNAKCGDGVVYAKNEACDDGNTIDTDGCNKSCKMVNTFECSAGYKWDSDKKICSLPPGTCPPGKIMNTAMGCTSCTGKGEVKNADKTKCLCATGYDADATGVCIAKTCPAGQALNLSNGKCAPKSNILKATPR